MKKRSRKKIWLSALALALVVAFLPLVGLGGSATDPYDNDDDVYSIDLDVEYASETPHEHDDGESWIPLTAELLDGSAYTLTGDTSYYYLPSDLNITNGITVDGTVTLCLNGHLLDGGKSGIENMITVEEDATLILCDCSEDVSYLYRMHADCNDNSDFYWEILPEDWDGTPLNSWPCENYYCEGGQYCEERYLYDYCPNCDSGLECEYLVDCGDCEGGVTGYDDYIVTIDSGIICGGERGVFVKDGGTFELRGGAIADNAVWSQGSDIRWKGYDWGESAESAAGKGGGVHVASGGDFIMADGMICCNNATYYGGGVYIAPGASADIRGGLISSNVSMYGGGVYHEGTALTIRGDAMLEMNRAGYGGGLYAVTEATVKGYDTDDNARQVFFSKNNAYFGGGMYIEPSAVVTAENAAMVENCANDHYYDFYFGEEWGYPYIPFLFDMEYTLESATGDYTKSASNVYLGGGELTMVNCAIVKGNTPSYGGGVYIRDGGAFTLQGGEISDNYGEPGGGVAVKDGTFTVEGLVHISGNDGGSDVWLEGGQRISIGEGGLDRASRIGVKSAEWAEYDFLDAESVENFSDDILSAYQDGNSIFFSNDPGYRIHPENAVSLTDRYDGDEHEDWYGYDPYYDEFPGNGGSRFLTETDDPHTQTEIISGEVHLCMSGHNMGFVIYDPNDPAIKITPGAHLYLCDCFESGIGRLEKSWSENSDDGYIKNGIAFDGGGALTLESGALKFDRSVEVSTGAAFTMNGGRVESSDYGVKVSGGAFTMTDGTIRNRDDGSNTGVLVESGSTFTMTGGEITNNGHQGVRVANGATFGVSGTPVIYGNLPTAKTYSLRRAATPHGNVVLEYGAVITITGTLEDGAKIGVTLENFQEGVAFTSGWRTYMNEKDPADYFVSDHPGCVVYELDNGELALTEGCVVRFDSNGSSFSIPSTTVPQGSPVSKPSDPQWAGHQFAGWYTARTGGEPWVFADSVTEEMTLYARWLSGERETVTITFKASGDNDAASYTRNVFKGEETVLEQCAFTGYGNFLGWDANGDGTVDYDDEDTVNPEADLTLYAQWEAPAPETCTITFHPNGGEGTMEPQIVNKGEATDLHINVFTRDGYTFDDWNTEPDGSGIPYYDEEHVSCSEDLDLYAQWIEDEQEEPAVYRVELYVDGEPYRGYWEAEEDESDKVHYISVAIGEAVTEPMDPDDGGWHYKWYREDTFVNKWDFDEDTLEEGYIENGVFKLYGKPIKVHTVRYWRVIPGPNFDPENAAAAYWMMGVEDGDCADATFRTSADPDTGIRVGAWYANLDLTGEPFDFSTPIHADTDLYPYWVDADGNHIPPQGSTTDPVDPPSGVGGGGGAPSVPLKDTDNDGIPDILDDDDDNDGLLDFEDPDPLTPNVVDLGEEKFKDVDQNAWYAEYVDYVVDNGIMQGISDALFDPHGETSRAQIIMSLWRMEGEPLVTHPLYFSDVSEGAWYADALRWTNSEGIVLGYDDGRYGTGDPVTREQIATILWRYARFKGIDTSSGESTSLLKFSDAKKISAYAISALQWACGEKLVEGTVDESGAIVLDPQGSATRAQIAAILMRFCENVL
ncbi:MAG: InlB B-repeat-containing protein [Oscillospiraceae bacterium]|nr:InlB B-repeat-containing protein [Oscillospiraceae bacterium]